MSIPIGKANRQLMEKIKASDTLNTRLRSTEVFKELEKEIASIKAQ